MNQLNYINYKFGDALKRSKIIIENEDINQPEDDDLTKPIVYAGLGGLGAFGAAGVANHMVNKNFNIPAQQIMKERENTQQKPKNTAPNPPEQPSSTPPPKHDFEQTITPWSTHIWNNDTNSKQYVSGNHQFVNMAGRVTTTMNINGMHVPYYLSTGDGGKHSVAPGQWYPVAGIDPHTGWFNKGTEHDINNHYGSPKLKEVADHLNSKYGDLRNHPDFNNIPKVGAQGFHMDHINKHITPTSNGHKDTMNIVNSNFQKIKNHIDVAQPAPQKSQSTMDRRNAFAAKFKGK